MLFRKSFCLPVLLLFVLGIKAQTPLPMARNLLAPYRGRQDNRWKTGKKLLAKHSEL
jgi:hypothetical protein